MKRLATLVLTASFLIGSLLSTGQGASATPFSDVPANHWAYQALQSLAADGLVEGYPDGKFKGDRPLTRYEMAVLVARVIAKVQALTANAASKSDLDKLQKLIDAFKDELDALGVRVTNLEDSLDALDKRTKFAQSIEFHGTMLPNITERQRTTLPRNVATCAANGGANCNGAGGADPGPLVNAFISSDTSNSAYTQAGSGDQFRYDDKFSFIYHVADGLTVSIPFHLYSTDYGGEFGASNNSGQQVGIDPGVDITIAKAGAFSNILIKYGQQDALKSSRTGLAYKAPDSSQQGPAYEIPALGYQQGFSITGTINGLTDFQGSFVRVDPNLLNTQTGVLAVGNSLGFNSYLFNANPTQLGYSQNGYPGVGGSAFRSNTFTAGDGALSQVFLTSKAQIGTVYVSAYNGTLYNSSGQIIGGGVIAAPAFIYNDSYNSVVFSNPLPAGSTVTVSYVGLTANNNLIFQRYQINGRINQKIKGLPGAEIGVEFNRVFDFDDTQTTGAYTAVQASSPTGYGVVSDTVFGIDAQLPLGFNLNGPGTVPVLYGEYAYSKYTADYRNVPAVGDTAGVLGANFKFAHNIAGQIQYQTVGANYIDGAPFRYYGDAPSTFAYWKLPYFPAFYGFGNQLAQNRAFDAQFTGLPGNPVSSTATNATLSYITPMFNPFIAGGPSYFSSFTPNTQGVTGNLSVPFTVGDLSLRGRLSGGRLQEIRPNSVAAMQYGPGLQSSVKETWDQVNGGLDFTIPAFSQRLSVGIVGGYERLQRQDRSLFQYYPFNPVTGGNDAASVTAALAAYPAGSGGAVNYASGSQVSWAPNFIDVKKYTFGGTLALPVTKGVVVAGTYNQQTWGGYYQSIGQNIDQRKTFLNGSITYSVPNTNSSITLQFRNQQYKDNVIPSYNLNQNRQDILYTIRF